MKYQRDEYSCGVAAIMNALRCHGKKISEKIIRAHSSTSKDYGTSEHGIKNALERIGFTGIDLAKETGDDAYLCLTEQIESGFPVILVCQRNQHWIVAIGKLGGKVLIFNSSKDKSNKEEQGIHVLDKKSLLKKWKGSNDTFYGIIVKKV